jgi:hypothetical protein
MDLLKRLGEMKKAGLLPDEALQSLIDEYDPMVQVDRTAALVYPNWVKEVLYPELEKTGPTKFDASRLEHRLHPGQTKGVVEGNEIHRELKEKNLLEGCLGLADLQAIQKRGVAFFRKHFAGKAVFGWKSIVRRQGDYLSVPCLIGRGGRVVLRWRWLDCRWRSGTPALRFADQPLSI